MNGTELSYLLLSVSGIALLVGGAVWNTAASRAHTRNVSLGPKALALTVPAVGLILTVVGGYNFFAAGPPPLTPSERSILLAKFNDELNAVVARCNADAEALRQQRITATAGVASARPVLSDKAAADEAARQQLRTSNQKADENRTAARSAAHRAKDDALFKADSALREAPDAAEQRRNSRNGDSHAQYQKALETAQATPNILERGALQTKAREDRDRALARSASEYDGDLTSANTAWSKAQTEAEAQRIRAYELAEAAYQQESEAAARAFSRAIDTAAESAASKLNGIPEAAAVVKEFDGRERELTERCERDKADINQRLREQLGARR